MDIEYAAQALWHEMKRNRHLPPEWVGKLSMVEAYAVQHAIMRKFIAEGDSQAGWKVGLTSAAMRAQSGIAEPSMGFLLRSGHLQSGVHLRFDELMAPAIESELCLTMGDTLQGPGVTAEMARHAIAVVEPALEIAEVRGDFRADACLSAADNAQQKAFVTGAPSPFHADDALDQASVDVFFNGLRRASAMGAEVMGHPVHSVVWLANKLAEYDLALEAGMRVMSGSFTRQFAITRCDAVSSRFRPYGLVEVTFD
jgi:2-keto-4-pentenoate hydratase